MKPKLISVSAAGGRYTIAIAPGVMSQAQRLLAALPPATATFVITSPRVWRHVGKSVSRALGVKKFRRVLFLKDGESSKTIAGFESLCRGLSRAGADRRARIVAVGGGVVGDVAGYVAASYLRGIALVHIPTTLVAQVDSAIGGKTGVNLPEGKNLVGAFYPPQLVIADPLLLRTLPPREFRGGLAEVIKYGVIADKALFLFLEQNLEKILKRDPAALGHVITRCAEIKARVVSRDERESGLREILNFGHTFGHALESLTAYKRYQHGEAVAWGMMAAALLGHESGITSPHVAARIISLVRRLGHLPAWPRLSPAALLRAMGRDKKTRGGKLRFVLAPAIGKARSYDGIALPLVERVLHYAPHLTHSSARLHD
ncbi:MAG: 3-dehydroquinate synthase [Acidobacteriia bacterium]|nr:3-dehydroquinate synthase [Terriglobia bacterium]